jgi:hypothetical protein
MRAESFREVGGFNERLMAGEEPELCHRLREATWNIWRLQHDMTLHDAAMTHFRQWWRRAVRSGYGYADAMRLTLRSPDPLYKREVRRSLFWGLALPLGIGSLSMIYPLGLTGLLLYPAQIVRIAVARGAQSSSSWSYAVYMTIAKFAEAQGIMRFLWSKSRGKTKALIEYKRASSQ